MKNKIKYKNKTRIRNKSNLWHSQNKVVPVNFYYTYNLKLGITRIVDYEITSFY